jgi:hypothetical protein
MDTSHWTALNPDILFTNTTKAMYGGNLYRLTICCLGVAVLRYPAVPVSELVARRNHVWLEHSKRRLQLPHVVHVLDPPIIQSAEERMLERMREVVPADVKKRIEEPFVHFYHNSEQALLDMATALASDDHPGNQHLREIMRPASAEVHAMLESGKVLRKRKPQWRYRIHMRDGSYTDGLKESLVRFVRSQGNNMYCPIGLWDRLRSPTQRYIWSGYLCTNDFALTTLLALMDARLVYRIEEMVHAQDHE